MANYGIQKRTKKTPVSPLFAMVGTPRFARAYEIIKKRGNACSTRERERERERERVQKYLELPNIYVTFSLFSFAKNHNQ